MAIPAVRNASLATLAVDDRAGAIDLAGFPALTRLTLWSSGRSDLGFLRSAPWISSFKLEGVGQIVDLRGLENCTKLDDLEILEARVESLAPLRGLRDLRRCWLIGGGASIQPEPLDFNAVSALNNLEELRVTYGGRCDRWLRFSVWVPYVTFDLGEPRLWQVIQACLANFRIR